MITDEKICVMDTVDAHFTQKWLENLSAVLGERNGKSFEYTSSIADVNYKYRQIVVIYKNMFYIFTYTSTPEGYDLHADEVEQIIAKVKFK